MRQKRILLQWTKCLATLVVFLPLYRSVAAQDTWDQTRSIAESQYEIVRLHIKNKEFDKVMPACRKLFSLDFPKNHLDKLVDSAKKVVDVLLHHHQYAIAHQVLDEALRGVQSNKWKASLYKEKAYICIKERKDSEAMKFWEKAIELEKPTP